MGKAAVPMANVGRGGVRRPTGSRRLSALVGTQALPRGWWSWWVGVGTRAHLTICILVLVLFLQPALPPTAYLVPRNRLQWRLLSVAK